MSVSQRTAQNIRERLLKKSDPDGLRKRLSPRLPDAEPLCDRLPLCNDHTAAGLEKRQGFLEQRGITLDCLAGEAGRPASETLANNIENLVGFVQVPVAVIGPLRINGIEAHGDHGRRSRGFLSSGRLCYQSRGWCGGHVPDGNHFPGSLFRLQVHF